jgi:hypothetical protein
MKYVLAVTLATLLVVSAINAERQFRKHRQEDIETVIDGAELGVRRVRRDIMDCKEKCIELGKTGGSCDSTDWWYFSWTCGERGVRCNCG